MQDDQEGSKAEEDIEQLKARLESLIAGILSDTGEIAEIIKKIRHSPAFYPGMVEDMPGIEKKMHELKNLLRSIDGFGRFSSSLPLTLFPIPPSSQPVLASIDSFLQPFNQHIEFKGPYSTLNELFNQGLNLGSIIEFHSSSIAGMDACTTCAFIMIDAYMRSDTIETKNVRFVTAEPMRYSTFFKRLEPAIGQEARLDCIKVTAIDTDRDARALLENLAFTLDVPKHGLVIFNCIDTIIALMGYDNMARRDRLKSALFQALRQVAHDKNAIVVVTSLILGKPRQYERETYDYMASVEPQSVGCIKLRVLGRGQAYINLRDDGIFVSSEPVSFAPAPVGTSITSSANADKVDAVAMHKVEAFNELILSLQDAANGDPVAIEIVVDRAMSRKIVSNADDAMSMLEILKKMHLLVIVENGKVAAAR
ncbi:MAG: hypothetical protein Q6373_008575 [Candidatus Sigynarchaeota archaeon]